MANINKSVRWVGTQILTKVARDHAFADRLIEQSLQDNCLDRADRRLLVELVNGTLRRRGYLDWILSQLVRGSFKKNPFVLKSILQMAIYQLIYLDRIPEYAAVSEAVNLARGMGGAKWANFANGVLRSYIRKRQEFDIIGKKPDLSVTELAVAHSHPKWILDRWISRFGIQKTIKYCEYNNQRPRTSFRIHARAELVEVIKKELATAGKVFEPSPFFDDFIRTEHSHDFLEDNTFADGSITVQDESTAIASRLLAPEPGDSVIDMCAAPGGKIGHLARMMDNKGHILAVEVQGDRIARLRQNINRLKLKNIEIRQDDARRLSAPPADKVLLDVPCSGLGVLSKRPDLRWHRHEADIRRIQSLQIALLEKAASLVKKGGSIVYCTCTLEPEETFSVVEAFTSSGECKIDKTSRPELAPFYQGDGIYQSLPFQHGIDGSFAVRFLRN